VQALTELEYLGHRRQLPLRPRKPHKKRPRSCDQGLSFYSSGLGSELDREIDLLRFQVEEIDRAAIAYAGEDDALRAEEELLADATAIRDALAAAYHAVEDDGIDALGAASASLAESNALAELHTRVKGLQAELDELGRDLRVAADAVVDDPDRVATVRGAASSESAATKVRRHARRVLA
jgi:DNA repair ATPase RecN